MAAPQSPNSSSSGPASQVGSQSARPGSRRTSHRSAGGGGLPVPSTGVVGYEIPAVRAQVGVSVAGTWWSGFSRPRCCGRCAAPGWQDRRRRALVADKARLPREVVARRDGGGHSQVRGTGASARPGRVFDASRVDQGDGVAGPRRSRRPHALLAGSPPGTQTGCWRPWDDDAAASPRDRAPRDRGLTGTRPVVPGGWRKTWTGETNRTARSGGSGFLPKDGRFGLSPTTQGLRPQVATGRWVVTGTYPRWSAQSTHTIERAVLAASRCDGRRESNRCR